MKQALLLLTLCTLTWNPVVAPDLAGYALYTSLVPGDYVQGPAWIGNGTQAICEDLGLSADNLTHYFVVKAFTTTELYSDPSNEVGKFLAPPPPPPPPPTVVCLQYAGKSGKCKLWGTQ